MIPSSAQDSLAQKIAGANSSSSTVSSDTPRKEAGYPVVLMYGENDWMDVAGGFAAEQKLKEEKARVLKSATEEEKRRENGSAKVVIIQKAGHHVYLDGFQQFNEVMREEMEETKSDTKKFDKL